MSFEIVERPPEHLRFDQRGLTGALRMTAVTGKAVRVPLSRARSLYGGLGSRLKSQGFRIVRQVREDCVEAWCERAPNGNRAVKPLAKRKRDRV